MTVQEISLTVPANLVISSNRRSEIWKRKGLKDVVKPQALVLAKKHLTPVDSATVYVGITKGNKNAYDPANLTDTFKPAIDGIVAAGILPDDSHKHVLGPWPYHHGHDKTLGRNIRLTITLIPYQQQLIDRLRRGA